MGVAGREGEKDLSGVGGEQVGRGGDGPGREKMTQPRQTLDTHTEASRGARLGTWRGNGRPAGEHRQSAEGKRCEEGNEEAKTADNRRDPGKESDSGRWEMGACLRLP